MRATSITNLRREFDGFLFAPVGEDANGMLLSMVSVLARLNIDPWQEASNLAELPREAAIGHLAALLRKMTDASSGQRDPMAIARRLVTLLPARGRQHLQSPGFRVLDRSPLTMALMYLVFVSLVVGGQYVLGNMSTSPASSASSPVEPSPAVKADRNAAGH
jgi:hypothetical protein